MKKVLIFTVIGFCLFCGLLVVESGLFDGSIRRCGPCILLQKTADEEQAPTSPVRNSAGAQGPANGLISNGASDVNDALAEKEQTDKLSAVAGFRADDAEAKIIILGAQDPNTEDPETGYKFQLELSSKGAAIRKATFTNGNGNGFDNRDPKNPQPLVVFSPVRTRSAGEILAMANTSFVLADYGEKGTALPLDRLHWKSTGLENGAGGSQIARFEAVIKVEGAGEPVIRLVKSYEVRPGSYMLNCNIVVENLSEKEEKVYFALNGAMGLDREGLRSDDRNVVGGFLSADGSVVSSRTDMAASFFGGLLGKGVGLRGASDEYEKALLTRDKTQIEEAAKKTRIGYNLPGKHNSAHFLWAAVCNNYFTGILRPVPEEGKGYCEWVRSVTCWYRNPDKDKPNGSGDESIGTELETISEGISPAGIREYRFQLYLGPKDRGLFYENPLYRRLGFRNTITFMACCCCPENVIKPLAFGVLWIMKWMHGYWPHNYGIVIIVLVFLVRIILHPITKKSQVSMSKMQKLGPKAEEIKKKYANNKAEMNKQMMALYREQGASPIMGFLPMFVQMPIWIALWSAVYASIDLRGARFLPFWITDLSMPDAIASFQTITIPLLRWKIQSLNLLPLMMGVAFYLQQKLMPSQTNASTSPQVAQQQKMMMIMMPLLFPLMLYNGPSGVNLYIMSSTFAGVIEQYVIRKHIREKEQADSQGLVATTKKTGGKIKKKKPKPFFKT